MSALADGHGTVICNGSDGTRPCPRREDRESLGLPGPVAASVRKHLKLRGWAVNVPNPERGNSTRLDLCPAHKPAPREG